MNKLVITTLFAAMSGLVGTPQTAKAGDETIAAIGGFIGGVIVGSAIHNDRHHDRYDHREDRYDRGPRVIVEVGPRDRGYWKWVEVRTWIPGRWVVTFDHGRRVRYWTPGYHQSHRERVWVSVDRRRERDHGYAYGR